jgi:hypothetical protein
VHQRQESQKPLSTLRKCKMKSLPLCFLLWRNLLLERILIKEHGGADMASWHPLPKPSECGSKKCQKKRLEVVQVESSVMITHYAHHPTKTCETIMTCYTKNSRVNADEITMKYYEKHRKPSVSLRCLPVKEHLCTVCGVGFTQRSHLKEMACAVRARLLQKGAVDCLNLLLE